MAQMITTVLTDDLDGSPATETLSFGLDGKTYEIDLSADRALVLRESLSEYVNAARKSGSVKRPWAGERMSREEAQSIRAWSAQQGRQLAQRGRIPADVVSAYHQAA